jgi:hypothetical protein
MAGDTVAALVEGFAAVWFQETELGQSILGSMTLDAAIDAVFEALNSGLIKLRKTPDGGINGFTLCDKPSPPKRVITRAGRPLQ